MNKFSYDQDYSEKFIASIPIGHKNAISPPKELKSSISSIVDSRNLTGDVILSTSSGKYYRPFPFDNKDDKAFHSYIEKQLSIAEEIIDRCQSMKYTYNIITQSILDAWEEKENNEG